VNSLAVTHLDKVKDPWKVCFSYEDEMEKYILRCDESRNLKYMDWVGNTLEKVKPVYDNIPPSLCDYIQGCTQIPVKLKSYGPTYKDKVQSPGATPIGSNLG
jgi:adenylosuccinate synthase